MYRVYNVCIIHNDILYIYIYIGFVGPIHIIYKNIDLSKGTYTYTIYIYIGIGFVGLLAALPYLVLSITLLSTHIL